MKYLVKFFVVTFFLLVCTYASAEQKVVHLDMKFILNNSKAGKGAQNFLQKSFKENQTKFENKENGLKKVSVPKDIPFKLWNTPNSKRDFNFYLNVIILRNIIENNLKKLIIAFVITTVSLALQFSFPKPQHLQA